LSFQILIVAANNYFVGLAIKLRYRKFKCLVACVKSPASNWRSDQWRFVVDISKSFFIEYGIENYAKSRADQKMGR